MTRAEPNALPASSSRPPGPYCHTLNTGVVGRTIMATARGLFFSPPTKVATCPLSVWRSTRFPNRRSVRGRGGVIAVLYETHWKGLLRPSWERESDLFHFSQHIFNYWAGAPLQLTSTGEQGVPPYVCTWLPLNASNIPSVARANIA